MRDAPCPEIEVLSTPDRAVRRRPSSRELAGTIAGLERLQNALPGARLRRHSQPRDYAATVNAPRHRRRTPQTADKPPPVAAPRPRASAAACRPPAQA